MVAGGIPKYLALLRDAPSIALAVQLHAFTEGGYFTTEFDRIFLSHFGTDSVYRKLIERLARYELGRSRLQLAEELRVSASGELTRKLSDLESAGFITAAVPFDVGPTSRIKRYVLTDAFLRFYFAFMSRAAGESVNFASHILPSPAFRSWLGRSFEHLCSFHARQLAELLGFSAVRYRYGPFFRHHKGGALKGAQIDLLFDRADHVVTLCEMKYRTQPIGRDVISEVEAKACALPNYQKRTIQKVLITRSPPSDQLARTSYFSRILRPADLLR